MLLIVIFFFLLFFLKAKKFPDSLFVQKSNNHRGIRIQPLTELDLETKGTFVQKFIHKPLLIDGHKFDIGVYTIITSVDPLRAYVYDGDVLFRWVKQATDLYGETLLLCIRMIYEPRFYQLAQVLSGEIPSVRSQDGRQVRRRWKLLAHVGGTFVETILQGYGVRHEAILQCLPEINQSAIHIPFTK